MNKLVFGITLSVVVIALLMLGVNMLSNKQISQTPRQTNKSQKVNPSVPVPTRVVVKSFRGTIVSLANTNLTINTNGTTQTVSLVGVKDFKRIVSGSLDNNPQLARANLLDLKVGQQVFVATNEQTGAVVTIFIEK